VVRSDEPDDEEEEAPAEPVKRVVKKEAAPLDAKGDLSSIIDAWGNEDEED
jgi:hypothetical protein